MRQLVVASSKNLQRIRQVSDLAAILEQAPKGVVYNPHTNGFDLENEAIKINYVLADFDVNHIVTLWFMKTHPLVAIKGAYLEKEEGDAATLYCCDIALIDQLNGFQAAHIQRGETLPFIEVGKEEWFENANGLLLQAERKYDLRIRVTKYMANMYPNQQPSYDSLRQKVVEGVVGQGF